MAARRVDSEEFDQATELARGVRVVVAEQLRDSVIAADQMAGREEVVARLERLLFCERRIEEARGRQRQARLEGLPLAPSVRDEREFRDLMREAVAGMAVACAGWCAAMDYELARENGPDG